MPQIQFLTAGVSGERFCAMGTFPPAVPVPAVLVFAADAATTLESDDFNRTARTLTAMGMLCVSIDLACHGEQRRENEPPELHGWRHRIERGESVVQDCTDRARVVIDYLVKTGATDKTRIAAAGTSRGGFIAMHLAIQDRRVSRVAAYGPVTDLPALAEFSGTSAFDAVQQMALHLHAHELVDTDLWLSVGRRDPRIDEQRVVALVDAITLEAKAQAKPLRVALHRYEAEEHVCPPCVYDLAAGWLAEKLK